MMGVMVLRASPKDAAQPSVVGNSVRRARLAGRAGVGQHRTEQKAG